MARSLYDISPLIPLLEAGFELLTPNLRLARRIRGQWDASRAASGERAWEPAAVLPLEQWLQGQWRLALELELLPPVLQLDASQALEVWQQVIAADERDSGAYHLLRPGAAAELASEARETLLRWEQDPGSANLRQEFSLDADCGTFLRWLDRFETRLHAAGQGTAVDCMAQLARCADKLPRGRVALLEFDDIPPLYRSLVTALAGELREIPAAGEPGRRQLHSFADKRAELRAVAHWAAGVARERPAAAVGIVLSDMANDRVALEHLLRREFDCLGNNYASLPVNFSAGMALDRVPVVRDALAALALGGQSTTVAAVVALLRSRFLRLPDAGSVQASRFITRLYDAGAQELNTADLRYAASDESLGAGEGLALGQSLLAVSSSRVLQGRALPSVWAERFFQVLELWGWPGDDPLDSLEYQQVELWYRTLEDFRGYDAVCQPLEFAAALQLLRGHCQRQVSQPQTADSQVQVLGPLEAAGLRFDELWLCGMQATRWPAPARPNPFIPPSVQRRLDMPHATAEREWRFAEDLLGHYVRSAAVVHASYCYQLDDVPELPSALLQDFEPALPTAAPELDPRWTARWEQRQVEVLEDERAPPVVGEELADVGGGSALLEDQSQCPFRAFARRRLKVEPLSAFSLALSAGDRGSLLHDALNALWAGIKDHASLLALDERAETEAVSAAVTAAIAAFPGGRRRLQGRAFWQLETERLQGLLREWLDVERARGEFVVSQREEDIALTLGQLQLRLRVDRIDELPDGSRVIIDYKSGSSKVQDWLGERPARPQLLLYGIAAPDTAAALAFAQVRPRHCSYIGLGRVAAAPGIGTDIEKILKGRMDASDWDSLNQRWRENLERLAGEFLSGRAEVDPLASASCTWCGLQPLCRIGGAPLTEAEEEII